ncbi:MAG: Bug family tripartite tricarboxylate transporter substrate binding protein [Usitatibacter sp.]
MLRIFALIAVSIAAGAAPAPVLAQAWPSQPVKVIVPFSPGTGMDILAHTLGPKLSQMWGQPVVVENRPGASGNLGAALAAKSPPDGYTLLMGASTLIINKALNQAIQYDPMTDFAPVGLAANASLLLVANPKTGITTVAQLISQAREKPGALNYASPGIATPHHLAMELFKLRAEISLTNIPFSATGPALAQLLGGEVPLMFLPVHVAQAHVKAGKLNALAMGGANRSPLLPDVPTLAELGLRDADTDIWYALWAPANTPAALLARIDADMQRALAAADVRATLAQQGLEILTGTPEQLRDRMTQDLERWTLVVRSAGIKAE